MSGLATVMLVAGREIGERVRSRAMWIVAILTALLLGGLIGVPALIVRGSGPTAVGLVGPQAQALEPALRAGATAARLKVRFVDLAGGPDARAAVTDGTVAAAVALDEAGAVITAERSDSPSIQGLVQTVVSRAHGHEMLAQAGVPEAMVTRALTQLPVAVRSLRPRPPTNAARMVAALVAGYLLVYSIMAYSASVATGVAQEKTSRTAEVLLASARPSQLMAGKVLGIGVAGLGQMAIAVAAGVIANLAVRAVDIPNTVLVLLPSLLGWFVLGYALYAAGSAAAGALVARPEEVATATAPFTVFLVAAIGLVYAVTFRPDAWWVTVLSLLPPLAPILMPARQAMTAMPWWQIGLSVAALLAAIYLVVRVAARVYAASLVRGGASVSWGTAIFRDRS